MQSDSASLRRFLCLTRRKVWCAQSELYRTKVRCVVFLTIGSTCMRNPPPKKIPLVSATIKQALNFLSPLSLMQWVRCCNRVGIPRTSLSYFFRVFLTTYLLIMSYAIFRHCCNSVLVLKAIAFNIILHCVFHICSFVSRSSQSNKYQSGIMWSKMKIMQNWLIDLWYMVYGIWFMVYKSVTRVYWFWFVNNFNRKIMSIVFHRKGWDSMKNSNNLLFLTVLTNKILTIAKYVTENQPCLQLRQCIGDTNESKPIDHIYHPATEVTCFIVHNNIFANLSLNFKMNIQGR